MDELAMLIAEQEHDMRHGHHVRSGWVSFDDGATPTRQRDRTPKVRTALHKHDPRHGTTHGYALGCREACCRAASSAARRIRRHKKYSHEQIPHGTANGYTNYMCRCHKCRKAHADAHRKWEQRRRGVVS